MKHLLALTAASCLAACTTQPVHQSTAARDQLPEPVKLVQYQGAGFAFCVKECPAASEKVLYMSLDISSADAKERVLARLRAQMLRQTGAGQRTDKTAGVVEVERSARTNQRSDAWTIYALLGAADQPGTREQLARIVSAAPGAKYHLLGTEAAKAEIQSYRAALAQLGIPREEINAFVLQSALRSDVAIDGSAEAVRGAKEKDAHEDKKLLVIREMGRN